MPASVLLVDDDLGYRAAVGAGLEAARYRVTEASSVDEAMEKIGQELPDIVVTDMVMPGADGLELCRRIKSSPATCAIPILVMTASDRKGLEVLTLDEGADDYLVKPVSADRLAARCNALLRRAPPGREQKLDLGALSLDRGRKLVTFKRQPYPGLTPKEFEVLYELARHSPTPIQQEALYRRVWGNEPPSKGSLKTVEIHIRRVRRKLGWGLDGWLKATSGRGYSIEPDK